MKRSDPTDRPFRVDTMKAGAVRLFASYRSREEAETAARQLRALGVELVSVHGPDDIETRTSEARQ